MVYDSMARIHLGIDYESFYGAKYLICIFLPRLLRPFSLSLIFNAVLMAILTVENRVGLIENF